MLKEDVTINDTTEIAKKCLFTGIKVKDYDRVKTNEGKPLIKYKVEIGHYTKHFIVCEKCFEKTKNLIDKNQNAIHSHLLNGFNFIDEDKNILDGKEIHYKSIENFIQTIPIFKNPSDILNNIFIKIMETGLKEHKKYFLPLFIKNSQSYLLFYLNSSDEKELYLETLHEKKLISCTKLATAFTIAPTYQGLIKYLEITDEGTKSNRCFIAMSFDEDDLILFQKGISPACSELGFNAIRVDQVHPESDQTINDLIISEIKKSKFLISDFTKHKNGVYFEAGYGLGRGKKVIYTCHEDYFDKLHFDVKHFPILIYSSPEDLKKKLIAKIEAFILD